MRLLVSALLLLCLLVGFAVLSLHQEAGAPDNPAPVEPAKAARSSPVAAVQPVTVPSPVSAARSAAVENSIMNEMRHLRSLTDHPEQDEARIKAVAAGLSREDCAQLDRTIADETVHPDKRFAAAYLLTKASPTSSVDALVRLALAPLPAGAPDKVRYERVLRALAIEGLSEARGSQEAEAALVQLAQGESPLRNRARQALDAYLERKPPLRQQDEKALTQLLERSDTKI